MQRKKQHNCRICGIKINQGQYCMGHRQNYKHDHYAKSPARYDRMKQALQKEIVLLQVCSVMGLIIDEKKLKARISKLQSQLQEMEKLNPALKSEQGKEE